MTEPKKSLITGVSGQDGSYLAEFLLDISKLTKLGLSASIELREGL
jgi:GDP-D-mannose dehydratase